MVRPASRRIQKYDKKLDPDVVGKRFTALRSSMQKSQAVVLSGMAAAETKAKTYLEAQGIPSIDVPNYLFFVRELVKLNKKFAAHTRRCEAFQLLQKWIDRGLDRDLLAGLLGIFAFRPDCRYDEDLYDCAIYS